MLGGNNWGTGDPINNYGLEFNYGMQVLLGGDNFFVDNGLPTYGGLDDLTDRQTDDGDDLLDLGDGNYRNYAFGNGGNDKIIGGGLFTNA